MLLLLDVKMMMMMMIMMMMMNAENKNDCKMLPTAKLACHNNRRSVND